jgi:sulfur-carrier protein
VDHENTKNTYPPKNLSRDLAPLLVDFVFSYFRDQIAFEIIFMATVWIPALLRPHTGDVESLALPGMTLAELIDSLDAKFPGVKARLFDGTQLRPGLAVVIDTQVNREGLSASVNENSEVHFIPAIGGGQSDVIRILSERLL